MKAKQLKSLERISELLGRSVHIVKAMNAINLYSINYVSENIFRPILEVVFDCEKLKNLNYSNEDNFPAIDLGNTDKGIAFQITSTATSTKIVNTLKKFFERNLHEDYEELYMYIITERKDSYTSKKIEELINEYQYPFDTEKNILDYRGLLKLIEGKELEDIQKIEKIVEKHFGEKISDDKLIPVLPTIEDAYPNLNRKEKINTNLVEITFPETLYIAYLDIDRQEIIKNSWTTNRPLDRNASARDVVHSKLREEELSFPPDWITSNKQIITFYDLNNEDLPLSKVIDKGTIESFSPEEFYEQNEDQHRLFVYLLGRCLGRKLYLRNILWNHEVKLNYFAPKDLKNLENREEKWFGKKSATRTVFKKFMQKKDTSKISYCRHLAFRSNILEIGGKWYLQITPEWFITYDGITKSNFSFDKIDYLKRQERNQQVHNHFRFIVNFLSHEKPRELFDASPLYQYEFIKLHSFLSLTNHPYLPDSEWLSNEDKEEIELLSDRENVLF